MTNHPGTHLNEVLAKNKTRLGWLSLGFGTHCTQIVGNMYAHMHLK